MAKDDRGVAEQSEPAAAWQGAFGDAYSARNQTSEASLASRARLFSRVFQGAPLGPGARILEVGTNIGMNLAALTRVGAFTLHGVDLNRGALGTLRGDPTLAGRARVAQARAEHLPFADGAMDLVFTCGVLIHVPPECLADACREIVRVSGRYVLCAEYFSPSPEEVEYRGQRGLLFKRDFGAFFLDSCPELNVLDYGFFWRRFEFDDFNWWLLEKGRLPSR